MILLTRRIPEENGNYYYLTAPYETEQKVKVKFGFVEFDDKSIKPVACLDGYWSKIKEEV